jgi:hypothetical protein
VDTHLLKLGHLQNRILQTTVHKSHMTLKIPYVYGYIVKLHRTQIEEILKHVNRNVHSIGQGEARHRKYKRL